MSNSLWVSRTIAECLTTSFAGEWGDDPEPGNAVVFRATDIDNDGHIIGFGAARAVPASKLRAKLLQDGDILLEGSGGGPGKPVGRVALFNRSAHAGAAVCSNFFKTLRVNRNVVDSRFLWRKLEWYYRQPGLLALQQQTTGIINLKFVEYLATPLDFPVSILEQTKIAEVLDVLDTTIRQTEAIVEKLKQIKQGLLHDLLTRGLDASGELRLPQSEAPHLYKESPLGCVPNEWTVELLDSVATRGSGHTPSKSAASYWNGGIKWVSLADSHRLDKIYIKETDKEISELGLANSSAVKHQAGTVILSRDAGVGKSAILAGEMAVSQHFIAWLCGESLSNLYLYFMLQRMKPTFESIAIGSTIKTIGLAFFKKLKIVIPSRAEQDRIVEVILSNEAALQTHSEELAKLRLQKKGLMDDLLTGRIRVTPLLETFEA
jgi:type I restriction enzyme S subunit